MITPFEVYMVTELNSINVFLWTISIISMLVTLTFIVYSLIISPYDEKEEVNNKLIYRKICFKILGLILIVMSIATLLPSTNQAAAMIVLPKIAKSDFAKEAQNIPSDLTKLAEKYIKAKLDDNKEINK